MCCKGEERGEFCTTLYWVVIIDGSTIAATLISAVDEPPGAPTVERAGPLLPAEATKMMPCLCTTSSASSLNRPAEGVGLVVWDLCRPCGELYREVWVVPAEVTGIDLRGQPSRFLNRPLFMTQTASP